MADRLRHGQLQPAPGLTRPQTVRLMLVLESPRLMLRHFEPGDLQPLAALYSDPDIRRYYPDGVRTLEETREELEWFRSGHPDRPELGAEHAHAALYSRRQA
jgi:RimJ/RimL family protein N-acetyltransferase